MYCHFSGYEKQLCLECESDVSWSDCDVNQRYSEYCPGKYQRCASVEAKMGSGEKKYVKKCISRLDNPCDQNDYKECRATICDKRLCNFAVTPSAILIATPFQCNQCFSEISWKDCEEKSVVVYCGAGFSKCFKSEFKEEASPTQFAKGCTVPVACPNSSLNMPNAENRKIECCGQQICNMVEHALPSVFHVGSFALGNLLFKGIILE